MNKRTPFYDLHLQSHAKIVDFAGWDMPLHYGSQIEEHHQVRRDAGVFDVSHMGIVDLNGPQSEPFLRYLLSNDVARMEVNQALYTCMLNEAGGVIDDLIVYKINEQFFRLIVNAGTKEKDLAWMNQVAKNFDVTLTEQINFCMLAMQGPQVLAKLSRLFESDDLKTIQALKPFRFAIISDCLIARTGYTGEDGYEMIFPKTEAKKYWQSLLQAGMLPCGLGCRDTLRLEAGLNLYGQDMDETVTPFESNLGWTVALEPSSREFLGRSALEQQKKDGVKKLLLGLLLTGPGIMRHDQKVLLNNKTIGVITSGGYSPTLQKSIGFARITNQLNGACFIEIRGKQVPAQVVTLPFVRKGKKVFEEGVTS